MSEPTTQPGAEPRTVDFLELCEGNVTLPTSPSTARLQVQGPTLQPAWSQPRAASGELVELHISVDRSPAGQPLQVQVFEEAPSPPEEDDELALQCQVAVDGGQAVHRWSVSLPPGAELPDIGDAPGPRSEAERQGIEGGAGEAPKLVFQAALGPFSSLSEPLSVERRVDIDFDSAETGSALAGVEYLLVFATGEVRRGQLDEGGRLQEEGCPPGAYSVSLAGHRFPAPFSWG